LSYTFALHLQRGLPSQSLSTLLVTLLPHRCTLTSTSEAVFISVALSSRSRALGVTQQPALWCPDFPRHCWRDSLRCSKWIIQVGNLL